MYDFIIVGSGVSGGRIALELVLAGAKCLLLEAGTDFSATTFPSHEIDYSTQMFWGGGLEVSRDGRLGFLRAKCVGGTSVVNQALLDRFDDSVWRDWKNRTGVAFFDAHTLSPHYDVCEKSISTKIIEHAHFNGNAHVFTKALNKMGFGWKPLLRGQSDCKTEKGSDCIVCLGGCPRDSKQSSLITSIRRAREKGLAIESNFEVLSIADTGEGVVINGFQRGTLKKLVARRAALAAGALGNAKILLRSGFKKKLPALGTGFSCHPQFMTYGLFAEPINAHKGAFQAVKSDEPRFRAQGFKLENVFAPPIGTAMLMPGIGAKHQERMLKYRYLASMEAAIRDDATGILSFNARNDKLIVDKETTKNDRQKIQKANSTVRELFQAAGAKETFTCDQGFGLHLMGGCAIGNDGARSVVNPDFQLHDHSNISIADSSIFPSAPGINPSLTIMALSHKAAIQLVRK